MTQRINDQSINNAKVVSVVDSVLSKVYAQSDDMPKIILRELYDLKLITDHLREELRNLAPKTINTTHIQNANDELDEVVRMTEKATNTIMNACDGILKELKGRTVSPDTINMQITSIFEACSFQDITGQRISKVITALKNIDEKTSRITEILEQHFQLRLDDNEEEKISNVSLMNGPQLPGHGVSQTDVDRLLENETPPLTD
jgi:chemotaxis protein CheZ